MNKKYVGVTLTLLAIFLSGCKTTKINNETETIIFTDVIRETEESSFESISERPLETISETEENSIEEKSLETEVVDTIKETEQTKTFVAQGKKSLMSFLNDADENGYMIDNPHRSGSYVYADAITGNANYSLKYFVEDQKVFSVTIFGNNKEEMREDEFVNCIIAMAKTLNENLNEDSVWSYIDEAYANPDTQVIYEDTMFRYNLEEDAFTVSY